MQRGPDNGPSASACPLLPSRRACGRRPPRAMSSHAAGRPEHPLLLVVVPAILRQALQPALAPLFIEPAPIDVALRRVDAVHDRMAGTMAGSIPSPRSVSTRVTPVESDFTATVVREIVLGVDVIPVSQHLGVWSADAACLVIVNDALFPAERLAEPDRRRIRRRPNPMPSRRQDRVRWECARCGPPPSPASSVRRERALDRRFERAPYSCSYSSAESMRRASRSSSS